MGRQGYLKGAYLVHNITIQRDHVCGGHEHLCHSFRQDIRWHIVGNNRYRYTHVACHTGCQSGPLEIRSGLRADQRYFLASFLRYQKHETDEGFCVTLGKYANVIRHQIDGIRCNLARIAVAIFQVLLHIGICNGFCVFTPVDGVLGCPENSHDVDLHICRCGWPCVDQHVCRTLQLFFRPLYRKTAHLSRCTYHSVGSCQPGPPALRYHAGDRLGNSAIIRAADELFCTRIFSPIQDPHLAIPVIRHILVA